MASRLVTAHELLGELGYTLSANVRETVRTGLRVKAELDKRRYRHWNSVTHSELEALNITPADFHGEWNYVVRPRPNTSLKLKPLHCKM